MSKLSYASLFQFFFSYGFAKYYLNWFTVVKVNFLLRHDVVALLKYSKADKGGRGG